MRSYKLLLLIFALISIKAYSQDGYLEEEEYKCRHDELEHNHELLDIEEDMTPLEGRGLASYPQIRLYPYYGGLSDSPSSYRSYVERDLAPPVISYFEAALKVKYPTSGRLKISSSTICGVSIPSSLRYTGVEADQVIVFDAVSDSGSWVAESTSCLLASGTRRPIGVKTKFNRQLMTPANGNVLKHEKNTYLLIHELMHVFGFSNSLYPRFVDSNGRTRSGHIKSVSIAGKTHKVLNVPSLTDKLRKHYGCSSLQGAIMEDYGSSATAGSHFERRYFVHETMTSGVIHGRRVSQFSLGVLEASGWYEVNYDYAEPYWFGQGQGCSFITGSCSSSSFDFDEYCKSSSRGCAPHGRGGGSCSSDSKANGCRYFKPSESYDCENSDADNYARLPSLQTFGRGAGSRCFTGTLSSSSSSSTTSFCFKYSCSGSGSDTELKLQVGSKTVTCTRKGSVSVSGYRGSINCPDPQTYCNTAGKQFCPRGCMGRGSCVNNKCVCRSGYKGTDCGLRG
jgi:hypothetical protein